MPLHDGTHTVRVVLEALAVAVMVGLFIAPFVLYPLKVAVGERRKLRRVLNSQIEELRAAVDRLGTPYHMSQLGAALLEAGDYEEAAKWLTRALERDPQSIDTRFHLGRCYFLQRRYDAAGRQLEEVVRQRPTHAYGEAFFLYARALEELGDHSAARDAFEQFLKYYPNHPEATYRFARLLERSGEISRAATLLREMIAAVEAGPSFQKQRQQQWVRRAREWLAAHAGS